MGSIHDIFGEWVPDSWISWIIDTAKNCPQHTFLFLTKNVNRYRYFDFGENCWIGITDDCKNTEPFQFIDLENLVTPAKKFISFEPLLGRLRLSIPFDVEQIIIGAQTGPGAVLPKKEWIDEIMDKAQGKKIFLKNNLFHPFFPKLPIKQETAWRLNR
jgi:protein gp37